MRMPWKHCSSADVRSHMLLCVNSHGAHSAPDARNQPHSCGKDKKRDRGKEPILPKHDAINPTTLRKSLPKLVRVFETAPRMW